MREKGVILWKIAIVAKEMAYSSATMHSGGGKSIQLEGNARAVLDTV